MRTYFSETLSQIFDRGAEARLDRADEVEAIALAKTGDEDATLRLLLAYSPALRAAVSRYRNVLDTEEARSIAVATVIEAIAVSGPGDGLAVRIAPMLSKALDEASGGTHGISVPTRSLQRFYGLLRAADGDVSAAALAAPAAGMTVATFFAIHDAVRNVDALDAWADDDASRAATIERAAPIWGSGTEAADASDVELVDLAFAAVSGIEESVCRVSYGFDDYEAQPDAVVAERVGISRQKAQRTRSSAVGKMKTALGVA